MAVEADRQRNEGAAPRSAPTSPLRAPQEPALGPGLRGTATAATVVLLLAGGVLRVVLAILHHGVIWPDETYQMTEAAHRVVFGYGIVPWEFQQGLRSWIGPGFLVPPTALAAGAALAGALLVAAVALRPQLVVVVLGFVVATLLTRERARILGLGAGLVSGAALSGLLDTLTWGTPFAPLWRSVTFNVV